MSHESQSLEGTGTLPSSPKDDELDGSMHVVAIPWYLACFTEEILGEICTFSGVEALIRLFCTGSSVLRQKLSSHRCRLELRCNTDIGLKWSCLPDLISELKGITGISMSAPTRPPKGSETPRLNWSVLPKNSLESIYYAAEQPAEILTSIAQFPNLTSLHLKRSRVLASGAKNTTPVAWEPSLVANLSSLRHLTIQGCPSSFQLDVCSGLTALESIHLTGMLGSCYTSVFSNHSSLKKLQLPTITAISTGSISRPRMHLPTTITHLDIQNCQNFFHDDDPERQRKFFENLPSLKSLKISSTFVMHLTESVGSDPFPSCWDKLESLEVNGVVGKAFPLPTNLITLKMNIPQLAFPNRLPRTLRRLWLSKCRLLARSLGDLPPKLSVLTLTASLIDYQDENGGEIAALPLPPSVTSILDPSMSDWPALGETPEAEMKLLNKLPATVVLFEGTQNYVKVPDRLFEHSSGGRIGDSKWVSYSSAIVSDNVALLEYLVGVWKTTVTLVSLKQQLQAIVRAGASQSLLWLLKESSFTLQLSNPDKHGFITTLLMLALDCPRPLAILNTFLEAKIPLSIWSDPAFLVAVVELHDMAILQVLERAGVTSWGVEHYARTTLTAAIASGASQQIVDWLIDRGATSVSLAQLISLGMQKQTLDYLERLKAISKERQSIGIFSNPLSDLPQIVMGLKDISFLIPTMNWLLDPTNEVNLCAMRPPYETVFSAILLHICADLCHTDKPDDDRHVNRNIGLWKALKRGPAAHRSLKRSDFVDPESIIKICEWFISKGIDICNIEDIACSDTLFDVALSLDSAEFLRFLASCPNHGLERVILRSLQQTVPNLSELTEKSLHRARKAECSESVLKFLQEYQPTCPSIAKLRSDVQMVDPLAPMFPEAYPTIQPLFQAGGIQLDPPSPTPSSKSFLTPNTFGTRSTASPSTSSNYGQKRTFGGDSVSTSSFGSASPSSPSQRSEAASLPENGFHKSAFSSSGVSSSPSTVVRTTFGGGSKFGSTSPSLPPSTPALANSPNNGLNKPSSPTSGFPSSSSTRKTTFGNGQQFGSGGFSSSNIRKSAIQSQPVNESTHDLVDTSDSTTPATPTGPTK